jgi:V-type H+-transporting ATPase subunit H
LEALNRILQENFKELSKWEVYLAELESGRLEWGILHTEQFFRENARMMEGTNADFAPLKKLIQLLRNAEEDDILAIACFDLGEFIRHYPNGKSIVNRLGAKSLVMPLMEHENHDVQRQALQCISKMLVQNWRVSQELNHHCGLLEYFTQVPDKTYDTNNY